jgi:hypothetical protein
MGHRKSVSVWRVVPPRDGTEGSQVTTIPPIRTHGNIQFAQTHEDRAQIPEVVKLRESQGHLLEGVIVIERQVVGVGAILPADPRPLIQDAHAVQQFDEALITPMRALVDSITAVKMYFITSLPFSRHS